MPGAKAPYHFRKGRDFVHPDSVGADHRHRLEVIAIDAKTGAIRWSRTAYEGLVYDDRHRVGSYASPTCATDGKTLIAYFGSEGRVRLRLRGNPVVDPRRRRHQELRHGRRQLPHPGRQPGDRAGRRRGRHRLLAHRARQSQRERGVEDLTPTGPDELDDAHAGDRARWLDAAPDQRLRAGRRLRPRHRPRAVARRRHGLERGPDAAGGERPGDLLRRPSAQVHDGGAAGRERRPHRHREHRLDLPQGHRLHPDQSALRRATSTSPTTAARSPVSTPQPARSSTKAAASKRPAP